MHTPTEAPDGSMMGAGGVAQRWRQSPILLWFRLSGGLLLGLAGIWVVIAGPLYNRLWLVLIGLAMVLLGSYLTRLGIKGLRQQPASAVRA
jgi:hypothetical protein